MRNTLAHADTHTRNNTFCRFNDKSQILQFVSLSLSHALLNYLLTRSEEKNSFENFNELCCEHESFIAVN